ncbi:hypothetical protein HYH03_007626 [Edaphochlamys debaryana]|uniref:O-fucosyltransferase family protein n=1 Tax=Edaphochlamys debaryana TaxID=47281 RepID=A0A835Y314_9CHLO|nr:hypothetical protein HYH03_007626 [Edaphochlamys debaryana]|eukprot:KAG2494272.1 hypothetical protein HYH03_007626 [Edaphochlamys debaryana]
MRGRPDARYLVFVCYKRGGAAGADALRRNVWKDCCGLGDRMRGIQFLTRIAAATKRVLLVWQESPAPLERFLVPGAIDWRLTPELGIDPARDLVQGATHYRATGKEQLLFQEDILKGLLSGHYSPRYVTVSTNAAAEDEVGGPVPPILPGPLLSVLSRALFRLSPEVEEATQAALSAVGVKPGQPYVALHLRLGGQIGEENSIRRFSLGGPDELLGFATQCVSDVVHSLHNRSSPPSPGLGDAYRSVMRESAGLHRAVDTGARAVAPVGLGEGDAPWPDLPHVLITDNTELRKRGVSGAMDPWVSPEVRPVHIGINRLPPSAAWPGGVAGAHAPPSSASAAAAALDEQMTRLHIASLADFGVLVKATCLVMSPSGFSNQAQLLGGQRCAMVLGGDEHSTVRPCPGTEATWRLWFWRQWCRFANCRKGLTWRQSRRDGEGLRKCAGKLRVGENGGEVSDRGFFEQRRD